MKKTWRSIYEALSRYKKTCDLPPTFFHNGRTLSNTNEIAKYIQLVYQLDNNITNFSQYMDTPSSTQFKCITETETLKAIDNLENKINSDMIPV